MKELRFTLLTDGSSDQALMPILLWLLRSHLADWAIQHTWADLRRLPKPPKDLGDRIQRAVELYPCDVLFVHRDAERKPMEARIVEIRDALAKIQCQPPVVCVIPVRMSEAWLLLEVSAIKRAAGNPGCACTLQLPDITTLESLPNPKTELHSLLRDASELRGRHRARFSTHRAAQKVPQFIEDFGPLRSLPAFRRLEADLRAVLRERYLLESSDS
jgi:hypothetical protein